MSTTDNNEWLEALKEGDKVVVAQHGYGPATRDVQRVTRVTATLIRTSGGTFRRKDGRERGDGWQRRTIEQATPERLAVVAEEQRRREHIARLLLQVWKGFDTATLDAIVALLPPRQ